jgi:sporulation protein YlmC with PRC-barrel domain
MRLSKLVGLSVLNSKGVVKGTVSDLSLDIEHGCISRVFVGPENFGFKDIKSIGDKIILK